MKVDISEDALRDLKKMDKVQLLLFGEHIDKIADKSPGRHLKHGVPFYVEVVGQGRIVYQFINDTIFVLRCFASHKDYEKWYKT